MFDLKAIIKRKQVESPRHHLVLAIFFSEKLLWSAGKCYGMILILF